MKKLNKMKVSIDYNRAKLYLENLGTLTHLQVMRTLALINCCAIPSIDNSYNLPIYSHWASSSFLSMYYKDYLRLLKLLEGNEIIDIKYPEKVNLMTGECTYGPIRIATINQSYIKDCEIELSDSDYKHMIIHPRKLTKLGNLHSYNKNIKINISRDKFEELVSKHLLMKYPDKSHEQLNEDLDNQWDVITKINKTGKINPKMTIKGRNSSRITQLSHPIDDYITIDGEETIEFDQHATYLTLLPEVLNARISYKTDEFVKELEDLRQLIKNTPNLYSYISKLLNVDMLIIKKEVNKFFCDPKASRTYDYSFFNFFNNYYPELSKSILLLRCKKGPYSDFNKIESFIFSGAAKELLKIGIPAITKYDSLIVKMKDYDIAFKILNERFIKARISNKTKTNKKLKEYKECTDKIENGDNIVIKRMEEGKGGREEAEERSIVPTFSNFESLSVHFSQKDGNLENFEDSLSVQTLSVQRKKGSLIGTLKDGRFRVSFKDKKYNSKKNESFEDFKKRMISLGAIIIK